MIPRYEIFNSPFATRVIPIEQECEHGTWVKYEDVVKMEQENEKLKYLVQKQEHVSLSDCKE